MTSTINDMILAEARKFVGTWEWAGSDHNPKVLAMYADAGHPEIRNDEVPWCAAYVGAVLAKLGVNNAGSLLAKSYLNWGVKVDGLANAQPGDVVVLHRGTKAWQGHVAFLVSYDEFRVKLLGGNQNDQVNVTQYSLSRNGTDSIAGIRRVKQPKSSAAKSTTLGAAAGGAATAATSGIAAVGALDGTAQIVAVVGLLVVLAAFAWIFRERLKSFAGGVR